MSAVSRKGYLVIAYPESMPPAWAETLQVLPFGYACALHDKDTWKVDTGEHKAGELKKPHMHFFFQGVPTKKEREFIHAALGVKRGEDCRNYSAAWDYLTHENSRDKYRYSKDIIQYSPKFSQEEFEENYEPKREPDKVIMRIVEALNIVEYSQLLAALYDEEDDVRMEAHKYWVPKYIDSRRNANYLTDREAARAERARQVRTTHEGPVEGKDFTQPGFNWDELK